MTETKVRPLTIKESAEYAHIHEKTMLRAVQRGECRGYQPAVNAPWRIYQEDLDAWIRGEQERSVTETKVRPLTIKESAEYAHIHEKTMLRAVQRGECRGYQRAVNAPWRIYQEDLDAWIRGEQPTRRRKTA